MFKIALIAALLSVGTTAFAQDAQEIVAAADKVRNPGAPFRATVTFTEYVGGAERDHETLVVFSKQDPATHQFRNLVQYAEPARDAGKSVLLDGQSLWFFDPASKSSVRISAQQRLVGQAAIGDVLTVNMAVDYTATLLGTETIQDAGRQQRQSWHLELLHANDQAVYNRIELWVEQGSFHPIKGKLYSDSGRLLKTIYYRNFQEQLGGIRPVEAVILDAVDTSLATAVVYGDWRSQEIPDSWFHRDYLPRLQVK